MVVVQLCEVGAIARAWEEGGGRRELGGEGSGGGSGGACSVKYQ